jgi:acyl-coenzyme A thioesterase PaaI-like protein
MDTEPKLLFVTVSLKADYLRPTPMGVELEVRGKIVHVSKREVVATITISAEGMVCVH